MRRSLYILALSVLLAGCSSAGKLSSRSESAVADRMPISDYAALTATRKAVRASKPEVMPAYEALIASAESFLRAEPLAVTMQESLPPSGDRHDYMSMGPYWWPDPSKPDGLPYIRKDGQHNPEVKKMLAATYLAKTCDRVETLSLAYFLSGEEKYAAKAADFLRVFFLDAETRMNPNLTYGQGIPGRCTGRGIGLIDTAKLSGMFDMAVLLEESSSWTKEDLAAMQGWLREFRDWMLTSDIGKDEGIQKNNHGTAYDGQICVYSIYCGDRETAISQLENVTKKRFDVQFAADGSQPYELARTNSWGYSTADTRLWMDLGRIADKLGVDLWGFKNKDGIGLKEAVEWFLPFLDGKKDWIKKDISPTRGTKGMDEGLREYCRRYCPSKYPEYQAELARWCGVSVESLQGGVAVLTLPVL